MNKSKAEEMRKKQEQVAIGLIKDERILQFVKDIDEYAQTFGENSDIILDFITGALITRYRHPAQAVLNIEAIKTMIILRMTLSETSAIYDAIRGPSKVKIT